LVPLVKQKNINSVLSVALEPSLPVPNNLAASNRINYHVSRRKCNHNLLSASSCVVEVASLNFCCLLDTGAQISLISDRALEMIRQSDPEVAVRPASDKTVIGLNKSVTHILGVIDLKPAIFGIVVEHSCPFAVVRQEALPCCFIIGANFISANAISLNFCEPRLQMSTSESEVVRFPLKCTTAQARNQHRYSVATFMGGIYLGDSDDSEDGNSEPDLTQFSSVKCIVSRNELLEAQNNDDVLCLLKRKLINKIDSSQWTEECLKPFKTGRALRVVSDLLVIDCDDLSIPVVDMHLLIDISMRIHFDLAHIGKHKLIDIVSKHFFHPSLSKVVADICKSCHHCQLYKISSQRISPPTIKIQSNFPFDLLAMDLLQFPRSERGNVAVLVCVDHFSKFLVCAPLRDKKASTVSAAFLAQVLPRLVRVPVRVLTDNGPEFRAKEFENVLKDFNITHVFSTRFRAMGNGAVERTNRSVTELLKGLLERDDSNWDDKLAKAAIVYNSTYHSQLKDSPSQFILKKSHSTSPLLPVPNQLPNSVTWKEAHPKFSSFEIGHSVALKVTKIGNSLKYKLGKKFDGPFTVVKVQSNGVTYEISDVNGRIVKAHHDQLKLWHDIPEYLSRYSRFLTRDVITAAETCSSSDGDFVNIVDISDSDEPAVKLGRRASRRSRERRVPTKIIREKPLTMLPCSETRKCDPDAHSVPVNDSPNVNHRLISDFNPVDNDFTRMERDILDVPKTSSPIFSNNSSLQISRQLSSIGMNTGAETATDSFNRNFWLWLEQSLSFQSDVLSELSHRNVFNVARSNISQESSSRISEVVVERQNLVQSLSRHVEYMQEGVRSFMDNNPDETFTVRRFVHDARFCPEMGEASDVVPEIVNFRANKRITRSCGPVEEYPHVQPTVLERIKKNVK